MPKVHGCINRLRVIRAHHLAAKVGVLNMSAPIALSDESMSLILRMSTPLAPWDRRPFLEAVAAALRDVREPGDGHVARVCRQLQPKFLRPPELGSGTGPRQLKRLGV